MGQGTEMLPEFSVQVAIQLGIRRGTRHFGSPLLDFPILGVDAVFPCPLVIATSVSGFWDPELGGVCISVAKYSHP